MSLLQGQVDKELSDAWARKASFETRAFALITATLSLVTLYFVLQTQLKLAPNDYRGAVHVLFVTSLVLAFLTLVAATSAAYPQKYPMSSVETLQLMLTEAGKGNTRTHHYEIVEARMSQLEAIIARNATKGFFISAGFQLFFLAAIFLVATIATALLC